MNIDLAQVKQEIEKRLLEKDEEFQVSFIVAKKNLKEKMKLIFKITSKV